MKKMKLLDFLNENNLEPIDLSYDLEMSWCDYQTEEISEEISKKGSIGLHYDRWFKDNEDIITEKLREMARKQYKVILI